MNNDILLSPLVTDLQSVGGTGAVNSVNGKTGDVVLDAADVGAATASDITSAINTHNESENAHSELLAAKADVSALATKADKSELPTKTSQLTNNSGFITETEAEAAASSAVATHNAATDAHSALFDTKLNVADEAVKKTTTTGVISAKQTEGYASTEYSLLTGLYDGQDDHDAATVGQLEIVSDAVALRAKKVTLYSDGNAIYADSEMTTVLTYAQIKALVDDTNNVVVVDNGNYELRYEYENSKGEDNAIWFNANTMLNDKPYLYRIIINSSEQVLADEKELVEAETGKGLSENDYTDADKALVDGAEQVSNKTTTISSASTDTEYPSAKAVYTVVGNIETILTAINEGEG